MNWSLKSKEGSRHRTQDLFQPRRNVRFAASETFEVHSKGSLDQIKDIDDRSKTGSTVELPLVFQRVAPYVKHGRIQDFGIVRSDSK